MKTSKKWFLVLVLLVIFGIFLFACEDEPDSGEEEDVATVTLSATTLTIMEGSSETLSYTSDKQVVVQWNSGNTSVATVQKNSDGSATVTAVKAGNATITLKVLYNNKVSEYNCEVTVTEYTNEDLRVVYSDFAEEPEHYTVQFDKTEYAYHDSATMTVIPEEGYMFTKVLVGDTEYKAEAFMRNTDGSYSVSFTVNDKTESVLYTVVVVEMAFKKNISQDAAVTGLPEKLKMGETYTFTAELEEGKSSDEYLLVVTWNETEIEPAADGTYSVTASRPANSLLVTVGKKHKTIDSSYARTTDPAGDSKIVDFGTASHKGILVANFSYGNAKTAESYQFGIRFYNGTSFITRMDVVFSQGVMSFKDSKTGATYVIADAEDVKQRLVDGTFGVVVVRNKENFTVYITEGDTLVKAFETTVSGFSGQIGKIGSTMAPGMATGETVSFHYDYYDGEQDFAKYITVTPSYSEGNYTITGLSSTYTLWQVAEFTVIPEETYQITSVTVNGKVITGVAGENNAITYSVPVTDIGGFEIEVEVSDPSVPATLVWDNDANSEYTIIEGEKESYQATDVVSFTVDITSDIYKLNFVKFNGAFIIADEGVYTITLAAGENVVEIESVSVRVNGEMTYIYLNGKENISGDQPSHIFDHILNPSGTNTLVAIIGFKEALAQTAESWRVDLRFYSDSSKANFLAISFGKDAKGLSISNRFAIENTLYYKDVVEGDVDEQGVLNLLANGKLRIGIVKTGRVYTIYSDNGRGTMICLGDITMGSGIGHNETYYTIGFGGTANGLINNGDRHCSITWGYYDGFGREKLDAAFDDFFATEIVPSVTPDENEIAQVTGLEDSYNFLDTVTFKVTVSEGYSVKVTLNGNELLPDEDGNYTFTVTSSEMNLVITSEMLTVQPTVTIEGTASVVGINEDGYGYQETIEFSVVDTPENALITVTVNGVVLEAENGKYKFTVLNADLVVIKVRAIDLSKATLIVEYDDEAVTVSGIEESTEIDGCNIGDAVTFAVNQENFSGYTFAGVKFNGEIVEAVDGLYSVVLVSGENKIEIVTSKLVGTNYQKTCVTKSGAYSLNDNFAAENTKNAVLVAKVGFIPGEETSLLKKNGTFDLVELRSRAGGFLVYARINAVVENGVVTKMILTNRGGSAASSEYVYTTAVWNLLLENNLTIVCVRSDTTHFTVYSDDGYGNLIKMLEYEATGMTSDFTQFGIGVQNDPTANYYGDTLKLNLTWYANLTDFTDVAELAGLEYRPQRQTIVSLESEGVEVDGIVLDALDEYEVGEEVTFTVSPQMFSGIASIDSVSFNGVILTENEDGSYTARIAEGENIITVEYTTVKKASGTIVPNSTNGDQSIKAQIQDAFGTEEKIFASYVLVTKVKYANVKTNECLNDNEWAMDIRFNNGGFQALATLLYTNNGTTKSLAFGSRSAKSDCSDFCQYAEENIDALLTMLENGTLTIVVVVDGSTISLYSDDGTGNLVKMYTYTKAYSLNTTVDNKISFAQWGTKGVEKSTNSAYGITWALYEGADFTLCSELSGLKYTVSADE